MAKTVVGSFDSFEEARSVVDALQQQGFSRDDISIVANSVGADAQPDQGDGVRVADADEVGSAAGSGAVTGGVIGGAAGLLAGLAGLAIPGVGPILAAGPIAAALAGAGMGAIAGGLIGGLRQVGVSDTDAGYYAEAVRRGGALVTLKAEDERADDAVHVMERCGAVDIQQRVQAWRSQGWTDHDPDAAPYTPEEIQAERARHRDWGSAGGRTQPDDGPLAGLGAAVATGVMSASSAGRHDVHADNERHMQMAADAGGGLSGAQMGGEVRHPGGSGAQMMGGVVSGGSVSGQSGSGANDAPQAPVRHHVSDQPVGREAGASGLHSPTGSDLPADRDRIAGRPDGGSEFHRAAGTSHVGGTHDNMGADQNAMNTVHTDAAERGTQGGTGIGGTGSSSYGVDGSGAANTGASGLGSRGDADAGARQLQAMGSGDGGHDVGNGAPQPDGNPRDAMHAAGLTDAPAMRTSGSGGLGGTSTGHRDGTVDLPASGHTTDARTVTGSGHMAGPVGARERQEFGEADRDEVHKAEMEHSFAGKRTWDDPGHSERGSMDAGRGDENSQQLPENPVGETVRSLGQAVKRNVDRLSHLGDKDGPAKGGHGDGR